jgi:cobalt/nickel transport protein
MSMGRRETFLALGIALAIAIFLSPFASSWPDGLEKVAKDLGFIEKGEGAEVLKAPIPDYKFPGLDSEGVSTALSGTLGTLAMFGIGFGVARLLRRKGQ